MPVMTQQQSRAMMDFFGEARISLAPRSLETRAFKSTFEHPRQEIISSSPKTDAFRLCRQPRGFVWALQGAFAGPKTPGAPDLSTFHSGHAPSGQRYASVRTRFIVGYDDHPKIQALAAQIQAPAITPLVLGLDNGISLLLPETYRLGGHQALMLRTRMQHRPGYTGQVVVYPRTSPPNSIQDHQVVVRSGDIAVILLTNNVFIDHLLDGTSSWAEVFERAFPIGVMHFQAGFGSLPT